MKLSIMALSIMIPRITMLSKMTLSIIKLRIMTLSIMTFSIMTLRKLAFCCQYIYTVTAVIYGRKIFMKLPSDVAT
jgi:hypothetical protein